MDLLLLLDLLPCYVAWIPFGFCVFVSICMQVFLMPYIYYLGRDLTYLNSLNGKNISVLPSLQSIPEMLRGTIKV